jgi:hypothetical protein
VLESILSVTAKVGHLDQLAVTTKIGRISRKQPYWPKTAVSCRKYTNAYIPVVMLKEHSRISQKWHYRPKWAMSIKQSGVGQIC